LTSIPAPSPSVNDLSATELIMLAVTFQMKWR
jgi:hypothetical protein